MAPGSFFQIQRWKSSHRDPDAGGLVAAQPLVSFKATSIVVAEDGEVEFGDEVQIDVMWGRPLDLRVEPDNERHPPQLLQSLEVSCQSHYCNDRQSIVISVYPYGFDWFAAARLKRGKYAVLGKNPRTNALVAELFRQLQTEEDPQEVLNSIDYDPFGSDPKYLTARFLGPFERTAGGHVTLRNRVQEGRAGFAASLELSSVNKTPTWQMSKTDQIQDLLTRYGGGDRPLPEAILSYLHIEEEAHIPRHLPPTWLYGICEDFDGVRRLLFDSEEAKELLKNSESMLSSNDERMKRPDYELREAAEEIFRRLAKPILRASIFKALAGMPPPARMPALWTQGVQRRLVMHLVKDIFQDSMLNLARRLHSRRPHGETEIRELPAREIFTDWKTVEKHDEEWQTLLTEDLLHGSGAERFFDQVCLRFESKDEPEMVQACGMAAAAASLVDVPPRVMAWLEKLLRDKPTDLLTRSASYTYKKIRSRRRGHS
jgi:hypothetical protein